MQYIIIAEVRENHQNLFAGPSIYNDYVSQKSMQIFCDTLNKTGINCTFGGGTKELISFYLNHKDISDVIFINYNYGLPAHYKRAQSPVLLELMKARYSGADPFVALLVNDKEFTKKILSFANVLVPTSILAVTSQNLLDKITEFNLPLPLVVKPNCEGSSLGITDDCLCSNYNSAYSVACKLLPRFREVIIEQYIPGYECTVWVIGNPNHFQLIAPLLISARGDYYFKNKIFTLTDKANHIREYSRPEKILGTDIVFEINRISKKIFTELGLRDYARLDFRISKEGIYFIEANALPIFSQTSEIGKIVQLYGVTYEEICKMIINAVSSRLMA